MIWAGGSPEHAEGPLASACWRVSRFFSLITRLCACSAVLFKQRVRLSS